MHTRIAIAATALTLASCRGIRLPDIHAITGHASGLRLCSHNTRYHRAGLQHAHIKHAPAIHQPFRRAIQILTEGFMYGIAHSEKPWDAPRKSRIFPKRGSEREV